MSDLTLKDVAGAIGWLDSFPSDKIEFDSSQVTEEDDGTLSIHVEGYYKPDEGTADYKVSPKHYIEATFVLKEASHNPVWEDELDDWDEVDDDEDEDEDEDEEE